MHYTAVMKSIDLHDLANVTGGTQPAIRVVVPLTGGPIKKPDAPGNPIDNNTDKPITYPR